MNTATTVELDFLQHLHKNAVSAFPYMLRVGSTLEEMEAIDLYHIRDEVYQAVGSNFDSRLATHYAFTIASAQQVLCFATVCNFHYFLLLDNIMC